VDALGQSDLRCSWVRGRAAAVRHPIREIAGHLRRIPGWLLTRAWRASATPQPGQNREPGDLDQLQDGQPLRLDLQLRDSLLIPAEAGGKLSLSKLCPLPALQQQLPEFIMLRRPTFLAFHRGADLETPVEQRLRLRPTCPRTKCPQGREAGVT
jgi:hypothetical protein